MSNAVSNVSSCLFLTRTFDSSYDDERRVVRAATWKQNKMMSVYLRYVVIVLKVELFFMETIKTVVFLNICIKFFVLIVFYVSLA